jgi:hypothetical protein
MQHLGNYVEDYADLNFKFSTQKADGTPIALVDGVVSVYKSNSATQSTEGVTLSADFDSVTGLNNVKIDLSSNAFYEVAKDYSVIITAGTVDGVSVVGAVLASFSIENRNTKANLVSILGTALTETSGYLAAAFKKFFNIETPTGTINSLPDAVPGANGGLPTTNGTKVSQTVDLTAGQSIACSDKTGFALSATGADLILKSSTFIQAIVAAINELATYGLTALNTLLVTTGIKTATTAAPTDMALNSTVAKDATVAKEATLGTVAGYLDTEIASILEDTGTTLPATLAAILEDTGTTLPAALTTIDNEIAVIDGIVDDILVDTGTTLPTTLSGIAAAVWNYLTTALTTAGSIGKWFADWFNLIPPPAAPALGASDLVLVNNALTLFGHDTLDDLLGTDKATTICVQHYQQVVDAVLRAYQWNCAMTRSSELTAESTAPSFGYDYKYALPDGCLRVLRMQELDYKFKVEGSYLLTDEESAYILYIARISPASMDSLLKGAISAALAATIAFPLTNSSSAAKQMWDLYQAKLDEARTTDAFEGTHESMQPSEDSDWIIKRS